jgi:hypothetical protein
MEPWPSRSPLRRSTARQSCGDTQTPRKLRENAREAVSVTAYGLILPDSMRYCGTCGTAMAQSRYISLRAEGRCPSSPFGHDAEGYLPCPRCARIPGVTALESAFRGLLTTRLLSSTDTSFLEKLGGVLGPHHNVPPPFRTHQVPGPFRLAQRTSGGEGRVPLPRLRVDDGRKRLHDAVARFGGACVGVLGGG